MLGSLAPEVKFSCRKLIEQFLNEPDPRVGSINNERALQLELGLFFREHNYSVEFERPFSVNVLAGHTRGSKRDLDLLLTSSDERIAVELKVPLAGRVPETLFDFCTDVAFIEALVRHKFVSMGFALLVTSDAQFWNPGFTSTGIYAYFRGAKKGLTGVITKPTGAKDVCVVIGGIYDCSGWKIVGNTHAMRDAKYLLIEMRPS